MNIGGNGIKIVNNIKTIPAIIPDSVLCPIILDANRYAVIAKIMLNIVTNIILF